MDAPGSKAALGDLETPPFAEKKICARDANVCERDFGVPVRRVVVAVDSQHSLNLHPESVHGHQNHRLLLVRRRRRVCLAHENRDLAARVAGARGPPLPPVDYVVTAVIHDARRDVGCVR